jgi:lipopolysaccharide/colanic/teichoic acid biosynthesis glycosyltransferase
MIDSTQNLMKSPQHPQIRTHKAGQPLDFPVYVTSLGGDDAYFAAKRTFDAVVATMLLILLSPILLMIGIFIQFDSRGPMLFSQKRVASRRVRVNGQDVWELYPFTIYKFRTMVDGASADIHEKFVKAFIKNDESTMREISDATEFPQFDQNSTKDNGSKYKIKVDPRITRVGKWLRKTSLDELPQLINVVRGDMSLVGPRPALPYEVEEYKSKHMRRFAAYQGMTGYWQVTGRSEVNFDQMVELDTYYAKHQSLFLDFKILLLTPFKVLKGKGAE